MYDSHNYDLDKEYRQRTMRKAAHKRDVQTMKQLESHEHRTLPASVISLVLIVGSVISLLIFFSLPASAALF